MTVQTLINKIRIKVGDTQSRKWTDSHIINIINEGLEDLSKFANISTGNDTILITPYQREFTVSDTNFTNLRRARLDGRDIDILPFEKFDSTIGWEKEVGPNLKKLIYNKDNQGTYTLYPLLDETSLDFEGLNTNEGILIDVPNVTSDEVYGLITGFELEDIVTPENVYDEVETETYNPITHVSDIFASLEITYYRTPDSVTAVEDSMTVADNFSNTIMWYVSGMLLLEDSNSANVSKGSLYIQKYNQEKEEDGSDSSDGYQSKTGHTTYNTGFN
jgi:hypothetical protein